MFRPILALIAILSTGIAAGEADPDLTQVKRWVERQTKVRSVRSDIVQERQLRSLKRPLVNPGRFFFAAGSYRWELGQPPQTIAVQRADGDMVVLRPDKNEARRITKEQLSEDGAARGFSFLDAGFPSSYDSFARNFTVTEVALEGGKHVFTTRLNDRRAALAVRKVVFTIDATSLILQSVYLRFRDSSSITTRFLNVRENGEIDPALFEADLSGYKVVSER